MVVLHVKKGDESLFLFECDKDIEIKNLVDELVQIQNERLKISRICAEMEELADHGHSLPPNMQGLTDDQIEDLKLKDPYEKTIYPTGGAEFCKDEMGRRSGRAPNTKMKELIKKGVEEAKEIISKKIIKEKKNLTIEKTKDAMRILEGTKTIVYPMDLPPHDPIYLEFKGKIDLVGTQASLDLLDLSKACLFWAGKHLIKENKLSFYIGNNNKTKIIVKIQNGKGVPAREPLVSDEEKKNMMSYYYHKQQELQKLEECTDDSYYDSQWADNKQLKKHFQGIGDVMFQPGKKL